MAVLSIRLYKFDLVKVLAISATPLLESTLYGDLKHGSITLFGRLSSQILTRMVHWDPNGDVSVYKSTLSAALEISYT